MVKVGWRNLDDFLDHGKIFMDSSLRRNDDLNEPVDFEYQAGQCKTAFWRRLELVLIILNDYKPNFGEAGFFVVRSSDES